MRIMAGLLVAGFLCNSRMRPVEQRFTAEFESATLPKPAAPLAPPIGAPGASMRLELAFAWALVGLPLAWGVWQVFKKSLDLFR